MLLLGAPEKRKNLGATVPSYCNHCDNTSVWDLVKIRRWGTVYLIPLVPLGRSSWWLRCNICGEALKLERDEVKPAKSMCRTTAAYLDDDVPELEYNTAVGDFRELLAENEQETADAVVSEAGAATELQEA